MKIRKALPSDAGGAYKLLGSEKNKSFSAEDFRNSSRSKDAIFLVAKEGRQIIGYAIGFICPTKRSDCMLAETRVKESERGKGVGSKLLDAFCKEAFSRGAKTVFAEVKRKDCGFYGKNKFKETNRWIEVARVPD